MKKYYSSVRALHLYFGLFISPFILIFSISVLVLNHSDFFNRLLPGKKLEPVQTHIDDFQFRDSDLSTAKEITNKLKINGEIDWISKTDSTFSFPVNKPGLNKWISLNIRSGNVLVTESKEGTFKGMAYLHMMPGQHNANMRGNSFFMKVWRVMTDVFVYVVLFLSVTGVFLWYFLKPERKLGIYALAIGFVFFTGLLILLF
jgi:hypothetical protein